MFWILEVDPSSRSVRARPSRPSSLPSLLSVPLFSHEKLEWEVLTRLVDLSSLSMALSEEDRARSTQMNLAFALFSSPSEPFLLRVEESADNADSQLASSLNEQ